MPSLSSLLPGSGRSTLKNGLKKVLLVSYGPFDCNSGGHIAGFASELARHGLAVGVCGRGPVSGAYAFGPPDFEFFTLEDFAADPEAVAGFDGKLEPAATTMICWTPRKASRRPVMRGSSKLGVPYLVHFEDNEDHLSELRFAADAAAAAEDLAERRQLIAGAIGATFIEQKLAETLPPGLPSLLLEPGVDLELFGRPLPPHRRASLLRALGVPFDAAVIVYPGNIHRANAAEMAELYRAIKLVRDRGRPLVLVKTGKDDADVAAEPGPDPSGAGVIAVGQLERPFLIDLLKCADLFVQPGGPGPFNDYRLPSKLPEFMAIGRPVILPVTNVGLRLRHGEDALLLQTGSAAEIAGHIEAILADPALAAHLAANAQAFARRTWRWDVQGRKLAQFLDRLCLPRR